MQQEAERESGSVERGSAQWEQTITMPNNNQKKNWSLQIFT